VSLAQTLAGLQRSTGGGVRSSSLKRALLRKDPTFNEADHGFRAFGELLRHLAERNVFALEGSDAQGDPTVDFPEAGNEAAGFALLHDVVAELQRAGTVPVLSGLKNRMQKRQRNFSERRHGFSGFLQFVRAAAARGFVELEWDDDLDDYRLSVPQA